MAGEGDDQVDNEVNKKFRFSDLEFADATHTTNYAYYQRQIQNNKTLHSKFLKKSKADLNNTLKKPHNDTLLKVIQMEKQYIISQSSAKVDKFVECNKDFSTFVNSVAFEDIQIQGFESHLDK